MLEWFLLSHSVLVGLSKKSFLMSGQKEEFSSLLRCVLVAFLELFLKYLAVGSLYLFQ